MRGSKRILLAASLFRSLPSSGLSSGRLSLCDSSLCGALFGGFFLFCHMCFYALLMISALPLVRPNRKSSQTIQRKYYFRLTLRALLLTSLLTVCSSLLIFFQCPLISVASLFASAGLIFLSFPNSAETFFTISL